MKKKKKASSKPKRKPGASFQPPKLKTHNLSELQARLAELEDTLNAIRSGEVDALIVNGDNGDHVYSLAGAEQPYREFIERMAEGAITADPAGTILYCNQRFADMLDIPMEKLISTSLLSRLHPDDRAEIAAALAGNTIDSSNVSLQLKKNRYLPVRIAISPLQTGGAAARCIVVTDLTDQKEREMLQGALAQLKAASAAKDEFLAALSHELRTPLTPVLLTANALAVDPSLPAELRSDLDMIRRNVELEARLIDDLLDITRISRGKLTIAPFPVDLHATLTLAIDICQSDTAAKRLRFVTRLKAEKHYVSAEAVRLQQVFWNLIRNAVKFTPPGGDITISTQNGGSPQNPTITVTIADTGIGIEPGTLSRIFDAFEQGSGEITRRFGGLGLGLTITKRLVQLHGGDITVNSQGKNQGSVFTVTFPSIPAPLQYPLNVSKTNKPKPAASLRILLVEDHDDTRRNMTRLLSALSHTVVPAEDATTALKIAAHESFDIVISDIGLPDESGLELMKKLRSRHNLHGICLSGYGMEEDIARSLAAGFSQHLTKPINFERLEAAILEATNR